MDHNQHIPIAQGSDRSFAFLFALICLALGCYFFITDAPGFAIGLVLTAAILAGLGFFRPHYLHHPNRFWIALGFWLGKIISPVVLTAVFFCLVTPLAVISKMFGSDPLRLRKSVKLGETYWVSRTDEIAMRD